jgi:hypothetical protein
MRKEPIRYKAPTIATDAGGGTVYTYSAGNTGTLDWAEVEDVREDYTTQTIQPMQASNKRFKVRWRATLTLTDKYKVRYNSVDYKISTIERKGEDLIIKAKALV